MIESMEQQLRSLYEERDQLEQRFGSSSPDDIAAMVESLEAQLRDFYERFGASPGFDTPEISQMLAKLKDLSGTLDGMYSCKKVSFYIENEQPVLRAEWSEVAQTEGE